MSLEHPWLQRIDETDSEHRAFRHWLGVPGAVRELPSEPALAARMQWAERAYAYDVAHDLPDAPEALVRVTWGRMLRAAAIESGKLLEQSQTRPMAQLDAASVLRILELLAKMQAWSEGTATDVHFDADTPEEVLRAVETARKLWLRGSRG